MAGSVRYSTQGQFVAKKTAIEALRAGSAPVSVSRGLPLSIRLAKVQNIEGKWLYRLTIADALSLYGRRADGYDGSLELPTPELAIDVAVAICRVLPVAIDVAVAICRVVTVP